MPQYFNINNQVHVLPDEADPALYIKQPYAVITKDQADAMLAPPVPTLAQAQSSQIAVITLAADTAFSAITATYPKQEVDTWPNQYAEAWALQADPLAYTPTLTAIALASGLTVSAIATSVLAKAALFTVATGQIIGKRKLLTSQIVTSTTVEEAQAVIW